MEIQTRNANISGQLLTRKGSVAGRLKMVRLAQRLLEEWEDRLEPGNRYKIITYTPAKALEIGLVDPTPEAEADLFPLEEEEWD